MQPHAATRRLLLATLAGTPLALAWPGRARAAAPRLLVAKTPGCGCCEGWAEHLRAAGFACEVSENPDLDALKDELKVPADLRSCHTATVAGYVVEGHVPAPAVRRLLVERPAVLGLAVPGMPAGSPGMPSESPNTYAVTAFAADGGRTEFMRFVGETPAPA